MTRIKKDTSVRAVKAVAGLQLEHRVDGVRGLALRVASKGKKTWSLRYRTRDGAQRRMTLGSYPEVGLADARIAAEVALGKVAGGADPAKAVRAAKAVAKSRKISTVADLIEGYLADAEKGRHRPNGRAKRAGTLALDRYYAGRLVIPRFGGRPVAELTRAEVQRFLDETGEKSPANARHCRNVLRQAYNYAIRREITDKNPAQLSELARPTSRERVLDPGELQRIWRAAGEHALPALSLAPATGHAIRLAMLTLQRVGEIVGIHSREIDRDGKVWTIPAERTKNHRTHVVPLTDGALEVLGNAFDLTAKPGAKDWEGYAFPSSRHADQPMTRHAVSRAVNRLTTALKVDDAIAHDFRRTGATMITGERIGIPRFVVSRILNQISDTGGAAAVTGVYDRNEYLSEKRRALAAWASLLSEIVAGKARASNVIKLAG